MTDRSALHVAVVGAGISGLSAASLLSEAGIRCKVFEKNSRLGGLVSCTVEDGCLFHRVGGHVFNSKNKAVHDWFWAKFDRDHEFIAAKRKAAIWLNQAFVGYPIELSLDQLGKEKAKQVVQELIAIAGQGRPNLSELSFAGFLRANFGKTLCRTYFEPYNKKIWSGIDLDSVPLAWLDGKLPMIQPADIISKNILKSGDDMVHASFYYPARGGSQFIVDRIAANLDVIAEEVQSIEPEDGRLRINQHHTFSHVVFTGDVRRLIPMLGESWGKQTEQFNDAGVVNQLRSNGTTTMLCECDRNDYSWVYLPEEDVKCHRIIMTGNFSPANNRDGLASDRSTCTVRVH